MIHAWAASLKAAADVRFGSLADIVMSSRDVRFTPNSGHSASRLNVRFVPKAGIGPRVSAFASMR